MEPTWERRDLPVLRALVEYFDGVQARRLQPDEIAQRAGVGEDETKRAPKRSGRRIRRSSRIVPRHVV